MTENEVGRFGDADRATPASPGAPTGLRHSGGIPNADPHKVLLTHMGPSSGGFEMGFRDGEPNGVLHIIAAGLSEMMQLDSDKPLNVIEMDVQPAGKPLLRLTMQRANGRGAMALKAEAVRLLQQTLEAIESGRNEPLLIMRDTIRRWLADDITASAIEARSAKTEGLGPKGESAVATPDAPDQPA